MDMIHVCPFNCSCCSFCCCYNINPFECLINAVPIRIHMIKNTVDRACFNNLIVIFKLANQQTRTEKKGKQIVYLQ